MWALGVTGTYLGDYFGILMDHVVTSFPFNVSSAPMYYGSTMSFLGTAIIYGRPAGLFLTAEVMIVYLIALRYEEYVQNIRMVEFAKDRFALNRLPCISLTIVITVLSQLRYMPKSRMKKSRRVIELDPADVSSVDSRDPSIICQICRYFWQKRRNVPFLIVEVCRRSSTKPEGLLHAR